ncbi:hypothetical protein N510_000500 [Firmicutes bacterium ASF500]|nr:hypothetical protein N510_000500 [Firmicutes bacterium ASF500]
MKKVKAEKITMKKKTLALILTLCMAVTAVVSVTVAGAAGGLQEIKAFLNADITLKLDGEAQVLKDANGVRTYPITYNDTTYLPVRSIAGLLGVDVGWDQATQSVLLGDPEGGVDLLDTYKAYTIKGQSSKQVQSPEGKTENIGGVDVSHWLYLGFYGSNKEAHFNLGGKYTSLTFQVYAAHDVTLTVYGDNQSVLAEIPVTGAAVPKTITVPLFNTTELFFYYPAEKNTDLYIFDAKLS